MNFLESLDESLSYYPEELTEDDLDASIHVAARAYRDLLANGERVKPDYERAIYAFRTTPFSGNGAEYAENVVRAIVDAAIGDKLLVDTPAKED